MILNSVFFSYRTCVTMCSLSRLCCWTVWNLLLCSKYMLCPKRKWSLIFFSMPAVLFNAPCFSCTTQKSSGAFQIWELTHIWKCLSGLQWPEGRAQQRVSCVLYHITYRKSNVTCSKFSAWHSSMCSCVHICLLRVHFGLNSIHPHMDAHFELNWNEWNSCYNGTWVRVPALFVFALHF